MVSKMVPLAISVAVRTLILLACFPNISVSLLGLAISCWIVGYLSWELVQPFKKKKQLFVFCYILIGLSTLCSGLGLDVLLHLVFGSSTLASCLFAVAMYFFMRLALEDMHRSAFEKKGPLLLELMDKLGDKIFD